MNSIGDGFSGIFFTVAMAVIFISGMMTSTLSQKVCEKGILDSKGFIPWEEIRKVNASAENDEEVVVRLKRSYDNTLKIYCQKGMALEIEGYIRERITE